jgi:hypothetical protein
MRHVKPSTIPFGETLRNILFYTDQTLFQRPIPIRLRDDTAVEFVDSK